MMGYSRAGYCRLKKQHETRDKMGLQKKTCRTTEELPKDLDQWILYCNRDRTHIGRCCCNKTPLDTWPIA